MFGRRNNLPQAVRRNHDAGSCAAASPSAIFETPGAAACPAATTARSAIDTAHLEGVRRKVMEHLLESIDMTAAARLGRAELSHEIEPIISEIMTDLRLTLNRSEQADLQAMVVDEMVGLGPLEPLLADEAVTDIMVNGPEQVYVERAGKLELTDVTFRDDDHVMNIAQRIVTRVGRRIDQTNPVADARLEDGSRVNIIARPLALKGTTISIRKFSKKPLDLDRMVKTANVSAEMATVLKVAARARLNVVISGGTGSGKTTLLNAMSGLIDEGERVLTIEDAAELQLQQPHVVSLETRPENLEGNGEVTIRDLVKNALRMRPDRVILGEVRGGEAFDMLQAMNTGHDGSMCTLHANRPREALSRLENMVNMAGLNLPLGAIRTHIAEAVDMIVQIQRMRDGTRRVIAIAEVTGIEDGEIQLQSLFNYEYDEENEDGTIEGHFACTGLAPVCREKARYFGLEKTLLQALGLGEAS